MKQTFLKTVISTLFVATVFLACTKEDDPNGPGGTGGIVGDPSKTPEIHIVGLAPGDSDIKGTANNIDTGRVKVVLWAKTDIWYVQPLISNPYTTIQNDGTWENWTHPWSQMLALLVDEIYEPGSTRLEHPSSDPGVLAWNEYPTSTAERTIDFSGYTWKVKEAEDYKAGPGPNYFSKSEENVWLDGEGLHLKIDRHDNKWYCAEVFLDHSLGLGTYTFQLASRVDNFDYQTVFGAFVYESQNREIDIEFSEVLASPDNAQYVVQPWSTSGNLVSFSMPAVVNSSHQFEWRSGSIKFKSWEGLNSSPSADKIIFEWTYTGSDIPPPGGERMRFNLWLFNGSSPSNQGDIVTIKSFDYQN